MKLEYILKCFKEKVSKNGPYAKKQSYKEHPEIKGTKCHVWTGYTQKNYGIIGRHTLAHRVAYELVHGKGSLGKKKCLHKCDNTRCVRELHLFKGTQRDNLKDMLIKGRHGHGMTGPITPAIQKGENNPNVKLTEKQVLKIRKMYSTGYYIQKVLAKKFGVDVSTISDIITRRSWTYV